MRSAHLKIILLISTMFYACAEDVLQPVNRAPIINSLASEQDSVKTLYPMNFICVATDPDGDSLSYIWSVGGSAITDSGSSLSLKSPEYKMLLPVTCSVSDSKGGTDTKTIYLKIIGHDHHTVYSAQDSIEAREIALWLGRELSYSADNFYEVLWSINEIRHIYKLEYPFLSEARFQLPWAPGEIVILADSITAELISEEQFTGWDILGEFIRPETIDEVAFGNIFHIKTGRFQNPWRLSQIYSEIPGIEIAEPNLHAHDPMARFYPVCPVYTDERLSYLFLFDWDDLYYFDFAGEIPEFQGVLTYDEEPIEEWVNTAREALQKFVHWGQ